MSKKDIYQAILARDIIDMIRDNKNDADILEYISGICFQIDSIFEESGITAKGINWTEIFNYTDQKYYKLSKNDNSDVDEMVVNNIYDYVVQKISDEKIN